MPVQIKRRVVKKATPNKLAERLINTWDDATDSKPFSTKTNNNNKSTLGAKRMSGSNKELRSRISLWDVDSENEKAPIARGNIQLTAEVVKELIELVDEGEEIVELGVSIWQSNSDNEKAPSFTGLIKSPSEREAERAAAEAKNGGKKKSATNKRRSL